jgi:hypothetical protein
MAAMAQHALQLEVHPTTLQKVLLPALNSTSVKLS